MFNDDPLCENAFLTGVKWVVPMFVFLILIAWPLLKVTIGSQLEIMAMGINGIARLSTTPHVENYVGAPSATVTEPAASGSLESFNQIPLNR